MSAATATFSDDTKTIGDKIAGLTLKEAKELSDYLKDVYGIEPAAGGAVMIAPPTGDGAGGGKPAEKTEFDVILKGFDAAKKVNVIKIVREITGHEPDGRQEGRRRRSDEAQGRGQQGRGRAAQEEGRRSWRPGRDQVAIIPQYVARSCVLTALRCDGERAGPPRLFPVTRASFGLPR